MHKLPARSHSKASPVVCTSDLAASCKGQFVYLTRPFLPADAYRSDQDKHNCSSEQLSCSEGALAADSFPKLSFSSAVTGLTGSPQTPQVLQARQSGPLPVSANPSPQGSVYYTASESGSPSDSGSQGKNPGPSLRGLSYSYGPLNTWIVQKWT